MSPSLAASSSSPVPEPQSLNVQRTDNYGSPDLSRSPSAAADYSGSYSQLHHQRSFPAEYQAPQQPQQQQAASQYPPYGARGLGVRTSISQASNSRPLSGIYQHSNHSGSIASREEFRYRNDVGQQLPPQQYQAGLSRSTSRGAAAAMMGGGIPARQLSRSERRPVPVPGQQELGGNGISIPRKNSKRVSHHYASASQSSAISQSLSQPQGSPYNIEGGPLPSSEEWKDRGAAVSTRQEFDAEGRPLARIVKKGVKDFNFGRTLGEGSYSTVLAAADRSNGREYAIKVLDKKHIIKEKKVKYVNIERDTLNRLTDHPGIVRLYYTFQDERSLYFVLDVATGGELLGVLKKLGTFDEECTRFYAGQILDSIAYMHSRGVIHRDLKPENVLLDDQMHTKITDFGTAKILGLNAGSREAAGTGNDSAGDPLDGAETDRAVSFVGTAEYVSPELLTDKNACKASDLWAFGCIVYQLLAGRPPFKAANEYLTFQKIVALDYVFPDGFPPIARDLITRLLVLDPGQRLPIDQIRHHEFFRGIFWGKTMWKQKAPRLKPYVPGVGQINPIAMPPGVPKMGYNSSIQHSGSQHHVTRPQLRAITELPPPSQLDIDWSPVLTRTNERILKLGNLIVIAAPAPSSPSSRGGDPAETPRKLSRFFSSNTTKKRQRLVMITSSARIIVAAAGGEEKKSKLEIPLVGPGIVYRTVQDSKGLTAFIVETVSLISTLFPDSIANLLTLCLQRDKHYTFEDPRATTADPDGSKYSTSEWVASIDQACEFAASLANVSQTSYSGESQYIDLGGSGLSSPTGNTIGGAGGSVGAGGDDGLRGGGGHQDSTSSSSSMAMALHGGFHHSHSHNQQQQQQLQQQQLLQLEQQQYNNQQQGGRLRKEQSDAESLKAKKSRFSKRHSKGLAAVF